jgi:hypothetical protein
LPGFSLAGTIKTDLRVKALVAVISKIATMIPVEIIPTSNITRIVVSIQGD